MRHEDLAGIPMNEKIPFSKSTQISVSLVLGKPYLWRYAVNRAIVC